MTYYTENDIKTLLADPESHDTLIRVFCAMRHRLFALACEERPWGPTNELMSKTSAEIDKCLDRISDAKRKAKHENRGVPGKL